MKTAMKGATTRVGVVGTTGVAVALLIFGAAPGSAQTSATDGSRGAAAVTLHEVASLSDAAHRYRASARRQLDDDAARSYLRAGRLAYQAGKLETALDDLNRSVRAAEAAADATTAASASLDAAWVSIELRRFDEAAAQVARVRLLLDEGAIPAGERSRLEHRLEGMPSA